MIKKIHNIKHLGIFEDYDADKALSDFTQRNIIYGWNYSGKTTLSRLISYLDKDKPIDVDYSNVEFDVELEDGMHITQKNRLSSPCKTIVFNSDFIKENLHFDSSDDKIEGIKFAVGEVGTIHAQIKKIETYIEKAKGIIDRNTSYIQQYNSILSGFTMVAKNLTELLGLGRNFNKANVSAYISEWETNTLPDYLISPIEEDKIRVTATTQKTGSLIDLKTEPIVKYGYLCDKVKGILVTVPEHFNEDKLLSSDKDLYNWGKTGWNLYRQRPQLTKCAFCGGEITQEGRIKELNAYYTNEAAKLKSNIEQLKEEIIEEKRLFKTLAWSVRSDNDTTITLRQDYSIAKQNYHQVYANYAALLDKLIEELDDKYNSSLFIAKEFSDIDDSAHDKMLQWITSVKQIFLDSNSAINSFNELQTQAKEQYKKHYIAKYLIDHDYRKVKFQKDIEEYWRIKLEQAIIEKEKELMVLQNKLSSIDKGKEEINTLIEKFLHREDLSVEVTEDQYFILKRGGKTAKHLSDGERTAIAFSHFIVLLKSLRDNNKLKDYVVFIDDPISSLDANHIAQVYSLIISFFFQKGQIPNQPDTIGILSQQLFIATHNFEFFSFINKAKVFRNNKLNRRFYIFRTGNNTSLITNMPKCYADYNSEYVYLFSEINKAKVIKDGLNEGELFPEDNFYILPNVIRRFLEIYTLIKLPGNKGEIDDRIKDLMGDSVNELKILHNFSHFTSFERTTKHNELLSNIPDILDDVYKLLNKDPQHLKSLEEGIQDR
mgnify:CR=1 FL=1